MSTQNRKPSYHMVMLFYRPSDLGIPREIAGNDAYINTRNVEFDNAFEAIHYYANTRCPASQHISAFSKKELEAKKDMMIKNYANRVWLENNLYPYL